MSTKVTVEKHAPERRKKPVTTLHCGCTCCCCCCLHTVGSIVGAAVAPAIGSGARMPLTYYYDEELGADVPDIKRVGFSAVTIFWWIVCFLMFLCFALGIVTGGSGESLLITGVLVLLGFPALQLASALITLIVFACWPRPDKVRQIGQLGKIAGGVVLGTILGTVMMFLLGALLGLVG